GEDGAAAVGVADAHFPAVALEGHELGHVVGGGLLDEAHGGAEVGRLDADGLLQVSAFLDAAVGVQVLEKGDVLPPARGSLLAEPRYECSRVPPKWEGPGARPVRPRAPEARPRP